MANEQNPFFEMMKKQWEAMGMDPEQMMKLMGNASDLQNLANQQMQNIPNMQNLMGMFGDATPGEDALNIFDDAPEIKEPSDVEGDELKAILCSANLSYYNSQYINTLSTYQPVSDILTGLEEWWEITNKEELLNNIEWLEKSGHRIYFNMIWNVFKSTPKAEWRVALESLEIQAMTNDEMEPDRIQSYAENILEGYSLLSQYGCFQKNKTPNSLAWDFQRAISLCRFGYDVDFLSRDEALNIILRLYQQLKNNYSSWKEMSQGYLIGFAMWNGDSDLIEERMEQNDVLLTHKKSLWTTINW